MGGTLDIHCHLQVPPSPLLKKYILIYDHPFQGGGALFLQREAAFGEANERVFTPPDPAQVAGNIRPAGKAKEKKIAEPSGLRAC